MTTPILVRVAAVAGVLFGGLAVMAGTRVLAGVHVPDYVVLPWLVWYNVAAGLAGMAVGAGLWFRRPWATSAAVALAAAHGSVLVSLAGLRATANPVADDSLVAMTVRTFVWAAIALVVGRAKR